MEVRNLTNNCGLTKYGNRSTFKRVYTPRDYHGAREFAEKVYDHSTGMQKGLMWLKKYSGENLNNIITAVGTACVAPIFITYNPFSKEEEDTKKYSALRQPISAVIALGLQLPLMKLYNNWVDRHALTLGIEGMDLKAKPPVSALKPQVAEEYKLYQAACIQNNTTPMKKSKWINKRITALQDEAYYKELLKLRANPKFVDGLNTKALLKTTTIEKVRDEVFKDYLIREYKFTPEELKDVKEFNELDGKFKSVLKKHTLYKDVVVFDKNEGKNKTIRKEYHLKLKDINEPVWAEAEAKAVDNLDKYIAEESEVKFRTSQYKAQMDNSVEAKKADVLKAYRAQVTESSNALDGAVNELKAAEKKLNKSPNDKLLKFEVQKALAKKTKAAEALAQLEKNGHDIIAQGCSTIKKAVYDECIQQVENSLKTATGEEKDILELALGKLKKAKSINGVKNHGSTRIDVLRSVKIKKYLTTLINESELKLKNWKDRSGMIYGLMILPLICGVLNWAYPRVMEEFFPELSASKKAKAKAKYKTDTSAVKEAK